MPRGPTKASAQNGVACAKSTLIVYWSTFDTLTSLYVPVVTAAVAGSEAYSQLKTQSSAVKGWPSCHLTPCFSFQTTHRRSLSTVPASTLGTSAASTGT